MTSVLDIVYALDPSMKNENSRIMACAELDADSASMDLYFAERPDGDWLAADYETRMEYRRLAYLEEEVLPDGGTVIPTEIVSASEEA